MGRGFLHVVLMPEDGGQVRNFRVTAGALRVTILALVALVLAVGATLVFHVRTLRDAEHLASLRAENQALIEQLDDFRRIVDELEQGLAASSGREREARLLAGLDPVDEETRRLGIGGRTFQGEPPVGIRSDRVRDAVMEQGRRLDALQRQLAFQRESYGEVLSALEGQMDKLTHTPTICPVRSGYTLSSGFGRRVDPFTGRSGWHNGLDLRAAPGAPVLAPADGKVAFVGFNADYGLTIRIEHGFGVETVYCHLASASTRSGQDVRRGDRIGGVGSSGRSTGSHLHYEVSVEGRPINPVTYILNPSVIVD